MITIEEFTNAVKEYFRIGWRKLSDEQVDEYIYEEEAQELIINRYNEALEKYNSGKITKLQFLVGVASSAGNCLIYMY